MLGIRYLKVPPTTHVMQFKRGQVVRQGAGLSFFYFAPNSVLVQVPLASVDVPFVFNEVTADFQDATIQGELTSLQGVSTTLGSGGAPVRVRTTNGGLRISRR